MEGALATTATLLAGTTIAARAFPWGTLTYAETAAVRAALAARYAPGTANKMLAALRSSLGLAQEFGDAVHLDLGGEGEVPVPLA